MISMDWLLLYEMKKFSFLLCLAGGGWLVVMLLGLAACVRGGGAPVSPSSTDVLSSSTGTPKVARPSEATVSSQPAPNATLLPTPITTQETGVAVPPYYFGVNTYDEILEQEQVRGLATLVGAQMVRTIVKWDQIEGIQDQYDWSSTDEILGTLTNSNFTPLAMIVDNPKWIANTPCGPIQDQLAFAQFIGNLVARYPKVKYWMLYNEPDNSNFPKGNNGGCFGSNDLDDNGKPDYADYAEQLKTAWRAIHRANPDAELVLGALAFDNFDEATAPPGYPGAGKGGSFNAQFLANLLKYMQANPPDAGAKYFDILSFNFYPIYGAYWESQVGGAGIRAKANMLIKMLRDANVTPRLLVSETGDDSSSAGNEAQSRYVTEAYVRGLASGLVAMVWWTFRDFSDSAPPPTNTWKYGLIDQNDKPKPAYAAYKTVAHKLTGARFLNALSVQGGEGYLLSQGDAGIAIAWSSSDTPVTITFSGSALLVTDLYGTEHKLLDNTPEDRDSATGRIGIQVDKNPLYIQVSNP